LEWLLFIVGNGLDRSVFLFMRIFVDITPQKCYNNLATQT